MDAKNNKPAWATHILKWPADEETMYVGGNKYQMITTSRGDARLDEEVVEWDEEIEGGGTLVDWFLRHRWKVLYKFPVKLENK